MSIPYYSQMDKLKKAKTIKELKEALVEIFEELDVEMENIAYDVVQEALKGIIVGQGKRKKRLKNNSRI